MLWPLLAAPLAGWLLTLLIPRLAERTRLAGTRDRLAVAASACGPPLMAALALDSATAVWVASLLGWVLLALGWIDALCFRLPDVLTLPLLLAGLALTGLDAPDDLPWHALGAAGGYLALRGIAIGYRLLRGREGLGAGDAKLLAAAGAWLGPAALPWLVLIAAVVALAWAGVAALAGRSVQATTVLPFGPFLAAAFWLLWLYR